MFQCKWHRLHRYNDTLILADVWLAWAAQPEPQPGSSWVPQTNVVAVLSILKNCLAALSVCISIKSQYYHDCLLEAQGFSMFQQYFFFRPWRAARPSRSWQCTKSWKPWAAKPKRWDPREAMIHKFNGRYRLPFWASDWLTIKIASQVWWFQDVSRCFKQQVWWFQHVPIIKSQ